MIYLIIGNGRVAKHFQHYFKQLNLITAQWHYHKLASDQENQQSLKNYIEQLVKQHKVNTHQIRVFILIKDSAIDNFIIKHKSLASIPYIFHCSGSLTSEYAINLHPLMTFSHNLYTFEEYKSINFVTSHQVKQTSKTDKTNISMLLPDLPNKIYYINAEQKGLYHALCVISGNFSQILWQACAQEFENNLNLPREIIFPYLKQISNNFIADSKNCLTGPLARNDKTTIDKNITALFNNNKNLHSIYIAFCNFYKNINNIK